MTWSLSQNLLTLGKSSDAHTSQSSDFCLSSSTKVNWSKKITVPAARQERPFPWALAVALSFSFGHMALQSANIFWVDSDTLPALQSSLATWQRVKSLEISQLQPCRRQRTLYRTHSLQVGVVHLHLLQARMEKTDEMFAGQPGHSIHIHR